MERQRKIVEFLSDCRRAVPVKDIAQRCFISHQTASSQLKDLREKGYAISEAIGRESFYELREPLMRFCLEVKKQRGEPIRLFVDFLRLWYTREELHQRLGLEFGDVQREELWNDSRQNLSEALDDKFFPPDENNSRYQLLRCTFYNPYTARLSENEKMCIFHMLLAAIFAASKRLISCT